MVKYYFQLQWTRWTRKLAELSIHSAIGVMGSIILFVGLAELLFAKLDYAALIFVFIGIVVISNLGAYGRVKRLQMIFDKAHWRMIRLIENILAVIPFVIFLAYKLDFLLSAIILLVAILFSFIQLPGTSSWTMPTPFKRLPFEFTAGFRSTVFALLPALFIALKAVQVDNYNLGMAAMMLPVVISLSYYSKPEHVFFVWIFDMDSRTFLFKKIRNGLLSLVILTTPLFMLMLYAFPGRMLMTTSILCIGMVFLIAMIFAKYSAYPHELSLPQAILLGLSLWFPPLLLLVILIFYRQSIKRLQSILS